MDIITEIQKNQKEKIIISTNEYKGHKYVDLRVHYEDESSKEYRPSKKGIAFSAKVIPQIIEAVMDGYENIK